MSPRKIFAVATAAVLSLSLMGPAAGAMLPASVKTAVKAGATCTKLNATAKVGSTTFVCKKVSGKLVWAKYVPSAECKSARAQYATQNKAYLDIMAQITTAKTALDGISGTAADELRTQITGLESGIKPLETLVKQFKLLSDQICSIR